ncbi:cellulose binding domain-containing protein [Actinacidiphila sp. bgisy160]|uniref:cellulose binding domain-containing protein n=1 Tax=Actinacidiphila sp. bgisy160 TaxID=3413796 RepID=UPI003D75D117
MRNSHRRRPTRKAALLAGVTAGAVAAAGAFALAGSAQAATVGAAYSRTSHWSTGYTGRYEITNSSDATLSDWTLKFDLPAGTSISSLWNATYTVSGQHVTVRPASWNQDIAAGKAAEVGFVTKSATKAGDPVNCLINGVKCSVDDGVTASPSGRPTATASPTAPGSGRTPTATPTRTASPTATATPSATASPTAGTGSPSSAGFAPYVDTSLYPAFDLLAHSRATGVKQYNLAFVTDGGGCTPKWGGVGDLANDGVAAQIGDLRKAGGDVRVSFGGASGSELATTCSSVSALAAAYAEVVDTYQLTKVDFDVEGGAIADTAANTRRAQAIARLQASHGGLEVSYTLPVMPTGLTQDGVGLLADARSHGVRIAAVDIMAMDYGASFSGDMGGYAIDAATATQGQLKGVLGLSDAAAWRAVAVTPMIGVNDVATEVFKVDDATQLVTFARSKGLGRLSMWSGTRDKQCAGGARNAADATCSSIVQEAGAFSRAFAAYRG